MKAPGLICVLSLLCVCGHAQTNLIIQQCKQGSDGLQTVVETPTNATQIWLQTAPSLENGNHWTNRAIQRIPLCSSRSGFYFNPTNTVTFARCQYDTNTSCNVCRLRMLYNGYFLTVNPHTVLDAESSTDRYRLYVLHALLIDPNTGRIAATYPPFAEDEPGATTNALPLESYTNLMTMADPPAPGLSPDTALDWWETHGTPTELLHHMDCTDLKGAVVTPGIIDGHFHVTSWSKKLPDAGEQFGFFADVSDPSYYIATNTLCHYNATEALTRIVTDANHWLADNTHTGILLHGYVYTMIDPDTTNAAHDEIFLYKRDTNTQDCIANTNYLINTIGRDPQPESSLQAALLIHTSGQSCWYNACLHKRFNDLMGMLFSNRFDETTILNVIPPDEEFKQWTFQVGDDPPSGPSVFDLTPPFSVDLILDGDTSFVERAWIPFEITTVSNGIRTLCGNPIRDEVSSLVSGTATHAAILPFYRPIPSLISTTDWNRAMAFYTNTPPVEGKGYGKWDPRNPYNSNWFNGAELGLAEYFYDETGKIWRATGYAEHYVMRDMLGSIVLREPTVEDGIHFRRNLVKWCHRHGITGVQDIMFYRRRSTRSDFESYEALSYEHSPIDDPAFFTNRNISLDTPTGRLNLRVGMYYYIENLDQISDVLQLANPGGGTNDAQRLMPPPDNPEYPGWVQWTGWKLQLDGGTGARTFYSSAPIVKPYIDDPYPTRTITNSSVTFSNHTFGLLTMTTEQEQIFDSRETAALYWLVRESDPTSPFYNAGMLRNWTILKNGVVNWVGQDVNQTVLAADFRSLTNVNMNVMVNDTTDKATTTAQKVKLLVQQVNSGYSNTLQTLARLWYEYSQNSTSGVPPQVACHCDGDAGVDLYLRTILQLRNDVTNLPIIYNRLPAYWKAALPDNPDLIHIKRSFTNCRYRVEHLLNISSFATEMVRGANGGLDSQSAPGNRNVVFSTQPALLATDGQAFRVIGFPGEQELWGIPHTNNFWMGVPTIPRSEHHMACPLYIHHDIPFAMNTDPPSVRDPRPAINLLAAVSRCPIEVNPGLWLDQSGPDPDYYPPDYLAGKIYPPLGLLAGPTNPMQLSVEQALCAMTFWSAYNAHMDDDLGILASTNSTGNSRGGLADMVIWEHNPVCITNREGYTIRDLGRFYYGLDNTQRIDIVNHYLEQFRPSMTIVGGVPVYCSTNGALRWQGDFIE